MEPMGPGTVRRGLRAFLLLFALAFAGPGCDSGSEQAADAGDSGPDGDGPGVDADGPSEAGADADRDAAPSDAEADRGAPWPWPAEEVALAVHEAALTDYAAMTLTPGSGSVLACDLVPWSDGTKVKATTPFRSPWRTIQIARRPGDLIESSLILCLNEPSRIEDTSWIEPTKYAGIWWSLHIDKETWKTGPRPYWPTPPSIPTPAFRSFPFRTPGRAWPWPRLRFMVIRPSI